MSLKILNSQQQNSNFLIGDLTTKSRIIDSAQPIQVAQDVDPDWSDSFIRYDSAHSLDRVFLSPDTTTNQFGSELEFTLPNDVLLNEVILMISLAGIVQSTSLERGGLAFIDTVQLMHGNNVLEQFHYYPTMRDIVSRTPNGNIQEALSLMINNNLTDLTATAALNLPIPLFFSYWRSLPANEIRPSKGLPTFLSSVPIKLRIKLNPVSFFTTMNIGFANATLLCYYTDLTTETKSNMIAKAKVSGYLRKTTYYQTQPIVTAPGLIPGFTLNYNWLSGDVQQIGAIILQGTAITTKLYNSIAGGRVTSATVYVNGTPYSEIKQAYQQYSDVFYSRRYKSGFVASTTTTNPYAGIPYKVSFAPVDSGSDVYSGGLVMARINNLNAVITMDNSQAWAYYTYGVGSMVVYLDSKTGLFNTQQ